MLQIVRVSISASVLIVFASTAAPQASQSLFAELVEATAKHEKHALVRLLSTKTLSTSSGKVGPDNRLSGGPMRHGVAVAEIADKLEGCTVKQWRDIDSAQGKAYILWECPEKRVPDNDCYFYSYRAEMLDPRFHPANLFIHEMPSRDNARCGMVIIPPPRL